MDEAEIRDRAHRLWLAEGKPEGKADEHWERAKREVDRADLGLGVLKLAMMPVLLPTYVVLGLFSSFLKGTRRSQ